MTLLAFAASLAVLAPPDVRFTLRLDLEPEFGAAPDLVCVATWNDPIAGTPTVTVGADSVLDFSGVQRREQRLETCLPRLQAQSLAKREWQCSHLQTSESFEVARVLLLRLDGRTGISDDLEYVTLQDGFVELDFGRAPPTAAQTISVVPVGGQFTGRRALITRDGKSMGHGQLRLRPHCVDFDFELPPSSTSYVLEGVRLGTEEVPWVQREAGIVRVTLPAVAKGQPTRRDLSVRRHSPIDGSIETFSMRWNGSWPREERRLSGRGLRFAWRPPNARPDVVRSKADGRDLGPPPDGVDGIDGYRCPSARTTTGTICSVEVDSSQGHCVYFCEAEPNEPGATVQFVFYEGRVVKTARVPTLDAVFEVRPRVSEQLVRVRLVDDRSVLDAIRGVTIHRTGKDAQTEAFRNGEAWVSAPDEPGTSLSFELLGDVPFRETERVVSWGDVELTDPLSETRLFSFDLLTGTHLAFAPVVWAAELEGRGSFRLGAWSWGGVAAVVSLRGIFGQSADEVVAPRGETDYRVGTGISARFGSDVGLSVTTGRWTFGLTGLIGGQIYRDGHTEFLTGPRLFARWKPLWWLTLNLAVETLFGRDRRKFEVGDGFGTTQTTWTAGGVCFPSGVCTTPALSFGLGFPLGGLP